jgi:two-component system nitrate/nitrite response regulator NarL
MPLSVLLVDDDAFRGLARGMLVALGLTVVGDVGTVADARAAVAELRPDAVLVDVGLPDGDGLTLAGELCALAWHPRVVIISSDHDAAGPAALARIGAAGFVPKDELAGPELLRLLS